MIDAKVAVKVVLMVAATYLTRCLGYLVMRDREFGSGARAVGKTMQKIMPEFVSEGEVDPSLGADVVVVEDSPPPPAGRRLEQSSFESR